ncbi:MAG: hypothetical protein M3O88_06975 [Actinomycetota bacterium]|nr:hypothetical protein [Actinomycetota bacterium]
MSPSLPDSKAGHVFEYISPQLAQVIGYTPEELVYEPELPYDIPDPDDREPALRVGAVQFASGAPPAGVPGSSRGTAGLSPRTLEIGGLGEALTEYVQHANQEDATIYHLQSELSTELHEETRTIARRAVLEALSSVRKHAAAENATVRLADMDGGFTAA